MSGEGGPDRTALTFAEIIQGRRSVRQYRPDPVPHELVINALEAARWAPSPHGRMPWRFVVLTQPERKTQLADAMAAAWVRNLELDGEPAEIVAIRLAKSRGRITSAPVLLLPCLYLRDLDQYPDAERQQAETIMAVQSIGAAIQNLLLAAYQQGLDGGWMCAPLFCPETVVAALGLESTLVPQALITLGYAATDPKRRSRIPLAELVVLWD